MNLPMDPAYILTDEAFTLFHQGKSHTLHAGDTRFEAASDLLRAKAWDELVDLMKPAAKLQAYVQGTGVELVDEVIFWHGKPLHNYVTAKALKMSMQGFDVTPLLNFIGRVMENPSSRAVNELFGFLEKGNLPLTGDGHFLAYKRVGDGYRDMYSRSIDNSVGQTVAMPRNQVDDNPNNTCSSGLHFCSREYLQNFWGNHLMVLKIDPADVVSIPVDYNDTKGRTCRYQVVGELELRPDEITSEHWAASVNDEYDEEDRPEVAGYEDRREYLEDEGYTFHETASGEWYWGKNHYFLPGYVNTEDDCIDSAYDHHEG